MTKGFDLDVEYDEGHSPYWCEMDRSSDFKISVHCDPTAEPEEWESGWAKYPVVSIKMPDDSVEIALKKESGDRVAKLFAHAPSQVELNYFDAIVDLSETVNENEEPITSDNLEEYEDDVKQLLIDAVKEVSSSL